MTPTDRTPLAGLTPTALQQLLGRLCDAALTQRGEGMAVKEVAGGRYVHVNDVLLAWMGRSVGEVIGHADGELFDADTAGALRTADLAALAANEPRASEHHFLWAGARRDLVVLRVASAVDAPGPRHLTTLWSDRGAEQRREEQLRQALAQIEQQQNAYEALRREVGDQALRDRASGVYSRMHFEDQLRREVDLSTREHREFAIVLVEIDPPGAAGTGGPSAEPEILAAMGRLLRSGTRAMDCACRLEDRRFAVLLSGVGLATAHARMEGLRRRCATEIVVHQGANLGFTVSMGVASYPHTAHTQDELLAACHAALAEAQRRGGNHVTLAAIRFEPT